MNTPEKRITKHFRSGTSCHQCKNVKPVENLHACINNVQKNGNCRKKYCGHCIRRYIAIAPDLMSNNEFICPSCLGICGCSVCRDPNKSKTHVADLYRNRSKQPIKVSRTIRIIKGVQRDIVTAYPRDRNKDIQKYKMFLEDTNINEHGMNKADIYGEDFLFLGKINAPDKIVDKDDKVVIGILRSLKTETKEELRKIISFSSLTFEEKFALVKRILDCAINERSQAK